MRLSAHKKLFLTLLESLLAIVILGGAHFFVSGRILDLRAALFETQEKIHVREEERANVRILSLIFKERQSDFERMKKFFPDRKEPIEFIEYLEALGRIGGTSVSLTTDDARSKQDALFFQLTTEGEEENVRRIIRAFDLLPYDVSVQEINLRREGTEKKANGVLSSTSAHGSGFLHSAHASIAFSVRTSP